MLLGGEGKWRVVSEGVWRLLSRLSLCMATLPHDAFDRFDRSRIDWFK
jgi:hypothetical protein